MEWKRSVKSSWNRAQVRKCHIFHGKFNTGESLTSDRGIFHFRKFSLLWNDFNKGILETERSVWEVIFISQDRNDKGLNYGNETENVNVRSY